jgi:hypothetical protein
MAAKTYGLDKKQIALCEAMIANKQFYKYMNPERMVSLLWQVVKINNEKEDVKESAVRLLNKLLQDIVVN